MFVCCLFVCLFVYFPLDFWICQSVEAFITAYLSNIRTFFSTNRVCFLLSEKAGIQDRTTQNLATSIVVLDEEKTPYDIRDQGKATLTSTYTRSSHADRPSEAHDPLLNGVGNNADI